MNAKQRTRRLIAVKSAIQMPAKYLDSRLRGSDACWCTEEDCLL